MILGFGVADGWSDLGALGIATLCAATVALVLEFALVIPLSKRWGLSVDAPIRDKEDFVHLLMGRDLGQLLQDRTDALEAQGVETE